MKKQLDYASIRADINRQLYAPCKGKKIAWGELKDAISQAWQQGYVQIGKPVEALKANTKVGREELLKLGLQFRQCKTVTKGTLIKERCWTEGLLKKYGFTPDFEMDNPHYKRGAPMLLYQLNRVAYIERDEEVAADIAAVLARRPQRQQAALRAAQSRLAARSAEEQRQKAEQLESVRIFMESMEFIIPQWPVKELLTRAIAHYNCIHWSKKCSLEDEPALLTRISTDFLVHDCTEYSTLLALYPSVDCQRIIHSKVTAAIANAYPELTAQITAFTGSYDLYSSK